MTPRGTDSGSSCSCGGMRVALLRAAHLARIVVAVLAAAVAFACDRGDDTSVRRADPEPPIAAPAEGLGTIERRGGAVRPGSVGSADAPDARASGAPAGANARGRFRGQGGVLGLAAPTDRGSVGVAPGSIEHVGSRQSALIDALQRRVDRDPEDGVAQGRLAVALLDASREEESLVLAARAELAARRSLDVQPEEVNAAALDTLAHALMARHAFADARRVAERLVARAPGAYAAHLTLADALSELGEYDLADASIERAVSLADEPKMVIEVRQARSASLRGDLAGADEHSWRACEIARMQGRTGADTLAWCESQRGGLALARGAYEDALRAYGRALDVVPTSCHAIEGVAAVAATRGELVEAIDLYARAIDLCGQPDAIVALGDLYIATDRPEEAAAQYARVARELGDPEVPDATRDRMRAQFYADAGQDPELAFRVALRDWRERPDIYASDTLAWAALRSGRIDRARAAIGDALALGTKDARILYHAGVIAAAAGDWREAIWCLDAALASSPQFDPLRAPDARARLAALLAAASTQPDVDE